MSSIFYILSSLPYLDISIESKDAISIDEFLEECEVLGEKVGEKVKNCSACPKKQSTRYF